jgi:hypothetical protein
MYMDEPSLDVTPMKFTGHQIQLSTGAPSCMIRSRTQPKKNILICGFADVQVLGKKKVGHLLQVF